MNTHLRAIAIGRQQRSRSHHPPSPAYLVIANVILLMTIPALGLVSAAMAVMDHANNVLAETGPPNALLANVNKGGAKIYDRNGEMLYEVFDPQQGYRTTVDIKDISPYIVHATLAAEDPTFYENPGIDLRGIMRAAWRNIEEGEIVQGGSTITQQLVKNVILPEEQRNNLTFDRKIKEAVLALDLTRRYPKDELLALYLNEIYYGNFSYGIEAAAQGYFGKGAKDLTLGEAAMLAGLPQAPGIFSPLVNPEGAAMRQHAVLDLMVRHGFLSEDAAAQAKAEPLAYHPVKRNIQAPHFVLYIRDQLEQMYGPRAVLNRGLKVTTTVDMNLQRLGEAIVQEQVAKTARSIGARNAALVAIDPHTGQIMAMVGSAEYENEAIEGQVNMATAERQPGSSFKPITYVTAFMKGYTPATMLLDAPMVVNDGFNPTYRPQNVDKKFHGNVSVRTALSNSMNIPALKTIQYTGVQPVIDMARRMGITTLERKNWYGISLTLGGGEVKPLDMAFVYSVFANQGSMKGMPVLAKNPPENYRALDPVAILHVEDTKGEVLWDFKEPQEHDIMPAEYAYLITNILADNQARAAIFGNTLQLPGPRPAAVKTGTTEDLKDFWTVGYTPDLVTAVWMGNANNAALRGGFSYSTTGPIWERFMTGALEGTEIHQFPVPANIVTATVCEPVSRPEPVADSPEAAQPPPPPTCRPRQEVFVKGTVPSNRTLMVEATRPDGSPCPPAQVDARGGTARPGAAPNVPNTSCGGGQAAVPAPGEQQAQAVPPAPTGGVTVPNVIGRPEGTAKAALAAAGLAPGPYTNYQGHAQLPDSLLNKVCGGCVLSTTPAPGSVVPPGTMINIAVRKD